MKKIGIRAETDKPTIRANARSRNAIAGRLGLRKVVGSLLKLDRRRIRRVFDRSRFPRDGEHPKQRPCVFRRSSYRVDRSSRSFQETRSIRFDQSSNRNGRGDGVAKGRRLVCRPQVDAPSVSRNDGRKFRKSTFTRTSAIRRSSGRLAPTCES